MRILLACLALLGALSTPVTAVAHGLAHQREAVSRSAVENRSPDTIGPVEAQLDSDLRAMAPAAKGAPTDEGSPAVWAVGDDDTATDHPGLHQVPVATRLDISPYVPAARFPAFAGCVTVDDRVVISRALLAPVSQPPSAAAQPRAPPLG